jgi:hypothetical protein
MIQFIRQEIGQECSKTNMFATSVASYLHDTRYFDMSSRAPVVVQCADGNIQKVPGGWYGPRIVVLHDWFPNYKPAALLAKHVLCLGGFEHPDFGKKCIDLPSFPLDLDRFVHLPTAMDYDVVIGGALRENSLDALRKAFDASRFRKVALVCHTVFTGTARVFADLSAFLSHEGAEVVFRRQNMPARVLETLYLSAPAIIHLGHCGRGWLHSLAEYRRRTGAIDVFCEKEFGNEEFASVRQVAEILGNAT